MARALGRKGLALLLVAGQLGAALGGEGSHRYKDWETVTLWVNKVGPYHNPQETYPYFSLPFCKPNMGLKIKKKRAGIGEMLDGHELRNSGVPMDFKRTADRLETCSTVLSKEDAKEFARAVKANYWYNMYIDDLPIWGMVGNLTVAEDGSVVPLLFTHRVLDIAFNKDRIIEVNLTSQSPQRIAEGVKLTHTVSVNWVPTEKPFESRFERYLDNGFFEHQIHWFSIFNSFMMVIFLCGLVFLILIRTLRKDFAKFRDEEDADPDLADDSGWKQLHGDVFREPPNLMLFSALYGTGWQLSVLTLGVILYAALGRFHGEVYEERGEVTHSFIVLYALTSAVAGYASGSHYRQYFNTPRREQQDSRWQQTMLLTVVLFPAFLLAVVAALNSVGMYYETTNVVPLTALLKVFGIWMFVSFPLAVVGTLFGRHWGGKNTFPCRVNTYPRDLPEVQPWYATPAFVIPATGLLPFGSIFIEMYFIFTSFWNYKFYYVYGFMLLVYVILMIVTICTTVVAVYVQLNAENHRYQWLSFHASGSTAIYVGLYSIYYFYYKTQMTGLVQASFYAGQVLMLCAILYLACGAVGAWGAAQFVRTIFRSVKAD